MTMMVSSALIVTGLILRKQDRGGCNAKFDSLTQGLQRWEAEQNSSKCTNARKNEALLLAAAYVSLHTECPAFNEFETLANGGIAHVTAARCIVDRTATIFPDRELVATAVKLFRLALEKANDEHKRLALHGLLVDALTLRFQTRREALPHLDEIVAVNPSDLDAALTRCKLLVELGEFEKGGLACLNLVGHRKKKRDRARRATALHYSALASYMQGDPYEARNLIDAAVGIISKLGGIKEYMKMGKSFTDIVGTYHLLAMDAVVQPIRPRPQQWASRQQSKFGDGGWMRKAVESKRTNNSGKPAPAFSTIEVDHREAGELTPAMFQVEYISQNRPALLSGGDELIGGWPAFSSWTREKLSAAYGNIRVRPTPTPYKSMMDLQLNDSTLGEFLDTHMGRGQVVTKWARPYIFEKLKMESNLSNYFTIPPHFLGLKSAESHTEPPDFFELLIGGEGTGAYPHTHQAAWNAIVFGVKRWFLWPPSCYFNSTIPMGMTVEEWFDTIYPTLKSQNLGPVETVQYPGEVMFVPEGWWHAVLNLEDTLALSMQLGENFALRDAMFATWKDRQKRRDIADL